MDYDLGNEYRVRSPSTVFEFTDCVEETSEHIQRLFVGNGWVQMVMGSGVNTCEVVSQDVSTRNTRQEQTSCRHLGHQFVTWHPCKWISRTPDALLLWEEFRLISSRPVHSVVFRWYGIQLVEISGQSFIGWVCRFGHWENLSR